METPQEKRNPRMKRTCLITAAAGMGLVVIVLITAAAAGLALLPGAERSLPEGLEPVLVNITLPANGSTHTLNEPARVYAEAVGDLPIQSLELTINGLPFTNRTYASPAGSPRMGAVWAWTPNKEGEYVLIARAVTSDGQGSVSNVVRVNVLPADKMAAVTPVQTSAVTPDLTALASQAAAMQNVTPEPPPPGYGSGGESIDPPPPPEGGGNTIPQEPPQPAGDELFPGAISLLGQNWIKKIVPINPPLAPNLSGGVDECIGVLLVKDNTGDEAGFFLYRMAPMEFSFTRVATIEGKQGKGGLFSYHDPGLTTGNYTYYISAFNAAGETDSPLVMIHVTANTCAWVPTDLDFAPDSIPIDVSQPVEKAYCYGSAEGMPWVRLPPTQGTFMEKVNGKYDLAPYWKTIPLPKPMPDKVTLRMECWGWTGSTLTYLGSSSMVVLNIDPNTLKQLGQFDQHKLPGSSQSFLQAPAFLPAPYNLKFIQAPQQCKDHYPDANYAYTKCNATLVNGAMVLVWDWNPANTLTAEQLEHVKFVIYMNLPPSNQSTILDTTVKEKTMYSFMPMFGKWVYSEPEYFVRAYYNDGKDEKSSADSNHAGAGEQIMTVVGTQTEVQMELYMSRNVPGVTDQGPYWINKGTLPIYIAGHEYTNAGWAGDYWYQDSIRLTFNESTFNKIKGNIYKARLVWENNNLDIVESYTYPCSEVVDGEPLQMAGFKRASDVTAQVRMWKYGEMQPIIVTNRRKDLSNVSGVDVCTTTYKNFSLEVFTID